MKRLLACITTACVLCVPVISSWADEVDSSGRVRLSDDNSTPPPIPHVIGSDEDSGRAVLNGMGDGLPQSSPVYQETFNAPNLGYRMSGDVFTTQFRLDQRNGGLYGYDDGYANVGAFIPRALDENSLMFFDIRGLFTNNSDGGFNLGLGRRNYDAYGDRVYSQSIWLDYDGGHVNQYLQGGVSWAMTSRYWRTRVNVNRILSDQEDFIGESIDTVNPFFAGNQINLNRDRFREVAYNHADASIGGPIPLLGQFGMNWDFGLYYESSYRGQDGIGFMAHVDANLTEDLTMDVRYTNDDIFGTSSQLSFVYNFPDGRASRVMRQPRVHDYMLRPEERNYRVSTKQYTVSDSIPLLNSLDNSPITVAHVDPFEVDNVVAAGDGSAENPFNSSEAWNNLTGAEKAEFDIVLVQPGVIPDGSFFTNNLNSGFTIVENQRLLASTGRIVRSVGTSGNELLTYAPHMVQANAGALGTGTYAIPGVTADDTALFGTIFDPVTDPRPILTNDTPPLTNPLLHYSVVTIDNSFSVACESYTEVSGFRISGANPNMPTMLNSGIVTANLLDPSINLHAGAGGNNGTGVTDFDINSNTITDTVHGIHITHVGTGQGIVELNRIEGDGFNSNSGITINQNTATTGNLNLRVNDNLVFNVFGEDINNNGILDTFPTGSEDLNGNGKLDIGEDINGNGIIDVSEDNDKDGMLGADDLGIGISIVADGVGNSINSNFTEDTNGNGILDAGEDANGNGRFDYGAIVRNVTHLDEQQYFRQQGLDDNGNVVNTFTAQDINGDVRFIAPTTVLPNSDTDDNVGNKNGMNLFADNGATVEANVISNDTSFNNPYADGLLPTVKNPFVQTAPMALGNEYGFRAAADNGGTVTLASPTAHMSNSNFGHGAIFEANNSSTFDMLTPMSGTFGIDPVTLQIINVVPSEFNDNGLNGLFINGDNNSSLTVQVGPSNSAFDFTLSNPANQNLRNYTILNEFLRNGQDSNPLTPGNGIHILLNNGAELVSVNEDLNGNGMLDLTEDTNGNGILDLGEDRDNDGILDLTEDADGDGVLDRTGIFHAAMTDNVDSGLLIDLQDTNSQGTSFNNFTVQESTLSGNMQDGITFSGENVPFSGFRVVNNQINNNAFNGINFQLLNSTMTDPFIEGNLINGNGNLMTVNPVSQFNIDLVFQNTPSATTQALIQQAADRIEQLIVGDVPDVMFNGQLIDDIEMLVSLESLGGGILGFAGPTQLRNGTFIPFQGALTMNTDFASDQALFVETAVHEMMHALGFGTIWNNLGLIQNPSGGNPAIDTRFTGAIATAEYNALFGVNEAGVPVENAGGPGSADSHWRESVFDAEIMTPTAEAGGIREPISRVTTAQFQDLGYVVNLNASDAYTIPRLPATSTGASRGTTDPNPVVGFANALPVQSNRVVIDGTAQGNGINISVLNSNLDNVIIENNLINGNTGDGVRLIDPQFATNNEGDNQIHYRLNQINNNIGYGLNTSLNLSNHLDATICVNDISNNGMGGINVELSNNAIYHNGLVPPDSLLTPDPNDEESWFFGNTVNNNNGIGYHIVAEDNSQFTLVGSTPEASTINGNQDAGLGIEMSENTVGDLRLDNVTINGTQDADAGGINDNLNFNGEGIGIVLNDNAMLDNMRIGDPIVVNPANPGTIRPTTINGNLNNGISIVASGDSSLQNSLIANATISNNGTNGTGDGINIVRNQSAIVGDDANVLPPVLTIPGGTGGAAVPSPIAPLGLSNLVAPPFFTVNTVPARPTEAFVIRDSVINGNGGDGIDLTANLANNNDEYLIEQNDISGNGANGVNLFAQGDAEMLVDIRYSTINDNGANGIFLATNQNDFTDEVSITGTWVGLQIDNNAGDGIDLSGVFGNLNGTIRPLQIGSNFTEDLNNNGFLDPGEDVDGDGRLDSDGVMITNNGGNGIFIPGVGFYNVNNAFIDGNGLSGIRVQSPSTGFIDRSIISNNDLHGIDIETTTFEDITLTMTNSLIQDNTRDGIQLNATVESGGLINGTFASNPDIEVTLDTNVIRDNGGRGIDHMVRGDGSSSLDINNIIVSGNGEQGIYNLVTASTTQDNEVSADVDLAQDGSIFANAFMNFSITADPGFNGNGQSQIINNALGDSYNGGGLVFRVGTTGAVSNLTRPFENANSVDPRDLGGLVASIDNTNMMGNNGVDFWMHTFTSTVNPATTGGAWTDQNTNPRDPANDVYTPSGYQQDPLARIEIVSLSNLTGQSADVFGASRAGGTTDNQNFAFYNNNEPIFKSRTQGQDNGTDGGLDDNGPFNSGTRSRNATRLPARTTFVTMTPLPPDLTIIDPPLNSDNFLFPGVGESTMQINSLIPALDASLSGFSSVNTNFLNQIFLNNNGGISALDTSYYFEPF
ncbi:leishmanolysin-related zinc metalloendopeptidase [Rubinisphaera sp.]|uniref:beta strand repeat-containing protein n=1 Tax=Rubinisphaera sp. TaxID=2024857 RepID=UPI0025D99050|nr:leishmanolysin-related zinc metalloendopeptidase [Rubinisphaera sp.]